MSFPKTISITGSGRSGTNIIKKVYSNHSQIATLPFEYRFVIDPEGVVDFYQNFDASWSPFGLDNKLKKLERFLLSLAFQSQEKAERVAKAKSIDPKGLQITPPPYPGWELNKWIPGYSDFVKQLMTQLIDFEYAGLWPGSEEGVHQNRMYYSKIKHKSELVAPLSEFLNQCIQSILNTQQKGVFLEDNTHNLLHASALATLMPSVKHVHMIRDPRDVVASLKQQRWAPSTIDQTVIWYRDVLETWFSERSKLNDAQFMEVRFEDFIANPHDQIRAISTFCEIGHEPELLNNLDLSKHNIGRYKTELSAEEIKLIERELAVILSAYNYA